MRMRAVSSLVGILHCPISGLLDGTICVLLPEISDLLVKRVVKIWSREEGLD
jgi:hypothetical protein